MTKIKSLYKAIFKSKWAGSALAIFTGVYLVASPTIYSMAKDRNMDDYSQLTLTAMANPNMNQTDEDTGVSAQNGPFINSAYQSHDSKPVTTPAYASSKKSTSSEIVSRKTVTVTAYSSTPDQTDDSPFITANGTYVRDGIVACNFLPFGTKVKFPDMYGDKIFTVQDRMNKKHNEKIDIWMESRSAAIKFGVRKLAVEVVK